MNVLSALYECFADLYYMNNMIFWYEYNSSYDSEMTLTKKSLRTKYKNSNPCGNHSECIVMQSSMYSNVRSLVLYKLYDIFDWSTSHLTTVE